MWHVADNRFKEGSKEVKDDSKSRRSSTSRTKFNVERVKQVLCSDRCLTVRMIASLLDMKKEQCLENYHRKFGHAKCLRKNGAKTAK